ncbi:hypothetical protein [Cellvibrio fibrivorans]|uniref:Uncharacterized protein n=1 Tax=Cellvibrio fibrivorans TaxID=126350 RepID=A0ABU1V259_9GAMM|nr:hypothetical protein [Cellvibrio fibrivorans]MDR7091539.1 hypothetical protein [Cellvibrio fibrivorans]
MEKHNISPDRITKPIQLLGAWLVGLLTIDTAFLMAAAKMDLNSWQSGALTIAAILNVPIFIGALFLLQTKFRPELQEDSYYSTYLNSRTNEIMKVSKIDILHDQLNSKIQLLENKLSKINNNDEENSSLSTLSYAVNANINNQNEIESKLAELGVPAIRTFGVNGGEPENLIVAIAENLPKNTVNEILLLAKELGFEHFSYIEHFEDIEEDVLFGAYGKPDGKIMLKALKAA